MLAICIESSHQKGMGHLFRALNFIELLKKKNETFIVFVNNDPRTMEILNSQGLSFEIVDFADYVSNWENRLIRQYSVDVWINDRLDTDIRHSRHIKNTRISLVTFDDTGSGAALADIHVAALAFAGDGNAPAGIKLRGLDYLILNKDIGKFRRLRSGIKKLIVSMGGSDTYGVTVKIVRILKESGKPADIHIGPSFRHHDGLNAVIDHRYKVIGKVPSLVELFYDYDLAITGGGITPFEANASGLPCIIIANELFEIANGQFLDDIGSSVFAGHHEDIHKSVFARELDIENMSRTGMSQITLNGAENIYRKIRGL